VDRGQRDGGGLMKNLLNLSEKKKKKTWVGLENVRYGRTNQKREVSDKIKDERPHHQLPRKFYED